MDKLTIPKMTLPRVGLTDVRLAGGVKDPRNYIRDGLVFWLDGIERGGEDGKWIDLVSAVEFTPASESNVEWGNDYVSGQLNADIAVNYPYDSSTIEAVIRNRLTVTDTNLWFNCGTTGGISVGIARPSDPRVLLVQGPGGFLSYQGNVAGLFKKGGSTVSGNKKMLIVNGEANISPGKLDYWILRGNTAIVGASPSVNSQYEICSIRIYDRLLTEEEMRHNQEVDVKRFGLKFPDPAMTLELDDVDYPGLGEGQGA